MGFWKFSDRISIEKLGGVARTLAAADPHYLQLYIRKVSKDLIGIGFSYHVPEEKEMKAAYNEYFKKTSSYLKRNFGNDFAGWDLGAPVWILK